MSRKEKQKEYGRLSANLETMKKQRDGYKLRLKNINRRIAITINKMGQLNHE